MDELNEKLKALGEELKAADEQERQARKSVTSRRGFVRILSYTAVAAIAGSAIFNANASACGSNTTPCSGNTECNINTCGTTKSNTCDPNECIISNTCGTTSGGSSNTCDHNTCDHGNTCYEGDTCNHGNTCDKNICDASGGNTCNPQADDVQCQEGNQIV